MLKGNIKFLKAKKSKNFSLILLSILVLFLVAVVYIINNGFVFNLNKYAKITDQICEPDSLDYKSCIGGTKVRTCKSDGLSWGPWSRCESDDVYERSCTCAGNVLKCSDATSKNCPFGCEDVSAQGQARCKPAPKLMEIVMTCTSPTLYTIQYRYSDGSTKEDHKNCFPSKCYQVTEKKTKCDRW